MAAKKAPAKGKKKKTAAKPKKMSKAQMKKVAAGGPTGMGWILGRSLY